MRKELLVGLATVSLAVAVSGAQRTAGLPIVAPAPVMHAMPAAPAHVPVVAGNHMVAPTRAVSGTHTPVRTGPVHPVTRGSTPSPKPTVRPTTTAGVPTRSGTPIQQQGFLPSDTFAGQPCFADCFPAPGLGFDFPHFFAVHPNAGRFQAHFSGVIIPGWGGGFYFPVPYYTEAAPQEVAEENAPAPSTAEQQPVSNESASGATNEPPAAASRPSYDYTASRPVEDYVFVKRDGTRIFAVAYSLTADKIQYVTREGLRRTVSLDALDYDATMKSNEERGNTVTLPGVPPAAMAMVS